MPKRHLLTDIYYKNTCDDEWHRWFYTDGDPTGKEYNIWFNDIITFDTVKDILNEYIVCINEKKIEPCSIKFIRRTEPEPSAYNFGYIFMETWPSEEFIITKCK